MIEVNNILIQLGISYNCNNYYYAIQTSFWTVVVYKITIMVTNIKYPEKSSVDTFWVYYTRYILCIVPLSIVIHSNNYHLNWLNIKRKQ